MNALLTVKSLNYSKHRNTPELLRDISFQVNSGEQIVIYGESGGGKTKLVSLLAEIDSECNKQVTHDGITALMTQEFTLYDDLTVLENLDFSYTINGLRLKDYPSLLNKFALEDWGKVQAGKLPTGRKKMLQLACAVGREFSVLILDEPAVGLDNKLRQTLWKFLEMLNNSGKGTIILTADEHDLIFGDKCYRLEQGTLVTVPNQRVYLNRRTVEQQEVKHNEPA